MGGGSAAGEAALIGKAESAATFEAEGAQLVEACIFRRLTRLF